MQAEQDSTGNPAKRFAYDSYNKLISAADESNHRTIYTYDPNTHDLLTETLDPKTDPSDGSYNNQNGMVIVKTYAYYNNGNLNTVRVNSDPVTTYYYDTWGNTTTVVNAVGKSFSATFNALNNKQSSTEPAPGGTTNYTYDEWNRLTRVTHPDTNYVQTTYDFMSNKTSVRDENNHFTYFDFDSMNRVWRTRQDVQYTPSLVQITTTFHFNTVGDKDYAINPRNYQTNYTYDERHHLIRIDYPDNTSRRFHYDGNGNRDKRYDGFSNLTSYAYDPANRLQTITYPGTGGTVTYAYFPNGLRQSMADGTGTSQWVYNTANLLTSHYQPRPNQTVTYTYDANGRRRTMAMGGFTWTYSYDAVNQLTALDFNGGFAHYTYYDNGLVSDKLDGNTAEATYSYDNRSRTTEIKHIRHSDGFVFKDLTYQYDPASNVNQYQEVIQGESPNPTWTTTYSYDPANRLTGEQRTGSTGTWTAPLN